MTSEKKDIPVKGVNKIYVRFKGEGSSFYEIHSIIRELFPDFVTTRKNSKSKQIQQLEFKKQYNQQLYSKKYITKEILTKLNAELDQEIEQLTPKEIRKITNNQTMGLLLSVMGIFIPKFREISKKYNEEMKLKLEIAQIDLDVLEKKAASYIRPVISQLREKIEKESKSTQNFINSPKKSTTHRQPRKSTRRH